MVRGILVRLIDMDINQCPTLCLSSCSFSWLLTLLLYDYLSMCGHALTYVQDTNVGIDPFAGGYGFCWGRPSVCVSSPAGGLPPVANPAFFVLFRMVTPTMWEVPLPRISCPRWRMAPCRLVQEVPVDPVPLK